MEPLGERAGTNFNPGMDRWLQTHTHTHTCACTHTNKEGSEDERERESERSDKQQHVGHFLVLHSSDGNPNHPKTQTHHLSPHSTACIHLLPHDTLFSHITPSSPAQSPTRTSMQANNKTNNRIVIMTFVSQQRQRMLKYDRHCS